MMKLPFDHITEEQTYWVTRDHETLDISNMTSEHIFAVVRMLERYKAKVPQMMQEEMELLKEIHPEYFL